MDNYKLNINILNDINCVNLSQLSKDIINSNDGNSQDKAYANNSKRSA